METTFEILEKWLQENGEQATIRVYMLTAGYFAQACVNNVCMRSSDAQATSQAAIIMLAHKLAAPKGGE